MKKNSNNLFIALLFYFLALILNGCFEFLSSIPAQKKALQARKLLNLPNYPSLSLPLDIVSSHTVHMPHTSLNPSPERVSELPDIVSSHKEVSLDNHTNKGDNRQVATPAEISPIETILGELYDVTFSILNPVIKATKEFLGVISIIKPEEECLVLERKLEKEFEEALKQYPCLLALKQKLKKEFEEKLEKQFIEYLIGFINPKLNKLKEYKEVKEYLIIEYINIKKRAIQAIQAVKISEEEVKYMAETAKKAKAIDCDITTEQLKEMINGTLSIVESEQNKVAHYANRAKAVLHKIEEMQEANIKKRTRLAKAVEFAREVLETSKFAIKNINGSSHVKKVIQGQEVTIRDVLTVTNKIGEKVLECIENEYFFCKKKIDEEIKVLEKIKEEAARETKELSIQMKKFELIKKDIKSKYTEYVKLNN